MELQKQQYLHLLQGEEQSSGPPVRGNIIAIIAHMGALYRVCAQLVTKLPLHLSQNPVPLSARLPERPWAGLALPRTWGRLSLLAKKEAFTRSRFSASFPVCIAFCFNKWWSAGEIPKHLMSVGVKPTLKKAKSGKLGHCSLGPVAILDVITRVLVDDLTDKD